MNVELNDPMNAHIVPKERASQLSKFQKKLIVSIANAKTDPYPKRAERLRKLQFCTDECKFEVLSQSDYISEELYDCLADIYFGRVSDQDGESVSETPADQTDSEPPEADTPSEPPAVVAENATTTEKRTYTKKMTDEETVELIKLYLSGMKYPKLASIFGRTVDQIRAKIRDEKKKGKHREMFETNRTAKTTEERFDEIISTVDAGQRQKVQNDKPEPKSEPDRADGLPKCFTAYGTGFITTDGGLKLDEEPITALLRQKIIEKGLVQFWGEISIVITPGRPAGMIVSVEE